ncbi:phosphonate ABC transporter substrate-binding protein [Desulfovibrio litoralis]|uniref:Phosphonate transport system substrate-binding protein n=1 Tax=Desulfovibrio litoralis DSM 11393 TaxID=1121455 RepID=A0A1M7SSW8_9BACT|nr:phosphonate ABC transporter substrate-binding protein [Desulfovibrio litoralis]SHN61486.1 phosphonate transport system substrate-binding protein [Desulfovibrio litoralis DSM 11393]
MLKRVIFSIVCLVATFVFSGIAIAKEIKELNFGIISTESSQNLKQNWEPLLKRMAEETGYKINAFFAPDYAGIITAMQYGKVQLAWFGNKSAIEAVDRADGEIFAQSMDVAGVGGYYAKLIVNKNSPLNSVEDVLKNAKNLTFSNGDPNSTSGFVVPGYYVFAQNNVDPKKIFKRTLSANHETNALSVANKQVDVATCNNETLTNIGNRQPAKLAEIKEIWTSPLIPSDPLVYRKDLPADVKEKIKNFFITFGVEGKDKRYAEDKEILKKLEWAPFKAATNDHSLPIRQLELFKTKLKYEGDTKMAPEEKAAKIKEIDLALDKLNARLKELGKS